MSRGTTKDAVKRILCEEDKTREQVLNEIARLIGLDTRDIACNRMPPEQQIAEGGAAAATEAACLVTALKVKEMGVTCFDRFLAEQIEKPERYSLQRGGKYVTLNTADALQEARRITRESGTEGIQLRDIPKLLQDARNAAVHLTNVWAELAQNSDATAVGRYATALGTGDPWLCMQTKDGGGANRELVIGTKGASRLGQMLVEDIAQISEAQARVHLATKVSGPDRELRLETTNIQNAIAASVCTAKEGESALSDARSSNPWTYYDIMQRWKLRTLANDFTKSEADAVGLHTQRATASGAAMAIIAPEAAARAVEASARRPPDMDTVGAEARNTIVEAAQALTTAAKVRTADAVVDAAINASRAAAGNAIEMIKQAQRRLTTTAGGSGNEPDGDITSLLNLAGQVESATQATLANVRDATIRAEAVAAAYTGAIYGKPPVIAVTAGRLLSEAEEVVEWCQRMETTIESASDGAVAWLQVISPISTFGGDDGFEPSDGSKLRNMLATRRIAVRGLTAWVEKTLSIVKTAKPDAAVYNANRIAELLRSVTTGWITQEQMAAVTNAYAMLSQTHKTAVDTVVQSFPLVVNDNNWTPAKLEKLAAVFNKASDEMFELATKAKGAIDTINALAVPAGGRKTHLEYARDIIQGILDVPDDDRLWTVVTKKADLIDVIRQANLMDVQRAGTSVYVDRTTQETAIVTVSTLEVVQTFLNRALKDLRSANSRIGNDASDLTAVGRDLAEYAVWRNDLANAITERQYAATKLQTTCTDIKTMMTITISAARVFNLNLGALDALKPIGRIDADYAALQNELWNLQPTGAAFISRLTTFSAGLQAAVKMAHETIKTRVREFEEASKATNRNADLLAQVVTNIQETRVIATDAQAAFSDVQVGVDTYNERLQEAKLAWMALYELYTAAPVKARSNALDPFLDVAAHQLLIGSGSTNANVSATCDRILALDVKGSDASTTSRVKAVQNRLREISQADVSGARRGSDNAIADGDLRKVLWEASLPVPAIRTIDIVADTARVAEQNTNPIKTAVTSARTWWNDVRAQATRRAETMGKGAESLADVMADIGAATVTAESAASAEEQFSSAASRVLKTTVDVVDALAKTNASRSRYTASYANVDAGKSKSLLESAADVLVTWLIRCFPEMGSSQNTTALKNYIQTGTNRDDPFLRELRSIPSTPTRIQDLRASFLKDLPKADPFAWKDVFANGVKEIVVMAKVHAATNERAAENARNITSELQAFTNALADAEAYFASATATEAMTQRNTLLLATLAAYSAVTTRLKQEARLWKDAATAMHKCLTEVYRARVEFDTRARRLSVALEALTNAIMTRAPAPAEAPWFMAVSRAKADLNTAMAAHNVLSAYPSEAKVNEALTALRMRDAGERPVRIVDDMNSMPAVQRVLIFNDLVTRHPLVLLKNARSLAYLVRRVRATYAEEKIIKEALPGLEDAHAFLDEPLTHERDEAMASQEAHVVAKARIAALELRLATAEADADEKKARMTELQSRYKTLYTVFQSVCNLARTAAIAIYTDADGHPNRVPVKNDAVQKLIEDEKTASLLINSLVAVGRDPENQTDSAEHLKQALLNSKKDVEAMKAGIVSAVRAYTDQLAKLVELPGEESLTEAALAGRYDKFVTDAKLMFNGVERELSRVEGARRKEIDTITTLANKSFDEFNRLKAFAISQIDLLVNTFENSTTPTIKKQEIDTIVKKVRAEVQLSDTTVQQFFAKDVYWAAKAAAMQRALNQALKHGAPISSSRGIGDGPYGAPSTGDIVDRTKTNYNADAVHGAIHLFDTAEGVAGAPGHLFNRTVAYAVLRALRGDAPVRAAPPSLAAAPAPAASVPGPAGAQIPAGNSAGPVAAALVAATDDDDHTDAVQQAIIEKLIEPGVITDDKIAEYISMLCTQQCRAAFDTVISIVRSFKNTRDASMFSILLSPDLRRDIGYRVGITYTLFKQNAVSGRERLPEPQVTRLKRQCLQLDLNIQTTFEKSSVDGARYPTFTRMVRRRL